MVNISKSRLKIISSGCRFMISKSIRIFKVKAGLATTHIRAVFHLPNKALQTLWFESPDGRHMELDHGTSSHDGHDILDL
jgi:hypothetical protein